MSPWLVRIGSGHWQRMLAVGDNITTEMVPFTFPTDGGGDEIREAPFVYVPNLIARIADTLTHHLE